MRGRISGSRFSEDLRLIDTAKRGRVIPRAVEDNKSLINTVMESEVLTRLQPRLGKDC